MSFSPRGLGGWGFPHVQGWLTQESPTIVTSILHSVTAKLLGEHICTIFFSTLHQDLEEVGALYFLSSPREVKTVAVLSPERGGMANIKCGMVSKCTNPVLFAVLCSMDSLGSKKVWVRSWKVEGGMQRYLSC